MRKNKSSPENKPIDAKNMNKRTKFFSWAMMKFKGKPKNITKIWERVCSSAIKFSIAYYSELFHSNEICKGGETCILELPVNYTIF